MRANSFFFCQGVEVEWSGTPKNWEHFYLNTYLSFNNVIFRTLCPTAKQNRLGYAQCGTCNVRTFALRKRDPMAEGRR